MTISGLLWTLVLWGFALISAFVTMVALWVARRADRLFDWANWPVFVLAALTVLLAVSGAVSLTH